MAFGIPNSDGGSGNGKFLGRIQFDTRVGFWTTSKRIQHDDGSYGDQKSEPFKVAKFALDIGSLEVGYIKFSSPPSFLVVPFGNIIPPQPEEMVIDAQGKTKKAFSPGFRVQVCSPQTFGDGDAYYFAHSAKTVLGPMDELYTKCLAAPEAAQGKVPVIEVKSCTANTIKTPKGSNTFYAPNFEVIAWVERPAVFGERTVPAPEAPTTAQDAPKPASAPAPTNHVPPPVKAPSPAPISKPAAMAMADDEVPFAPIF